MPPELRYDVAVHCGYGDTVIGHERRVRKRATPPQRRRPIFPQRFAASSFRCSAQTEDGGGRVIGGGGNE